MKRQSLSRPPFLFLTFGDTPRACHTLSLARSKKFMKTILLSLSLIVISSAVFAQAPQPKAPPIPPSIAIGSDLPNPGAMMPAAIGEPKSLEQAKTEKGLLVIFSANKCSYVANAERHLLELMKWSVQLGVGAVMINSNEGQRTGEESLEKMREYATKAHLPIPYVSDDMSMMADIFGARYTPEVYLFDGEGKLVYKGTIEDNPAHPSKSKKFYAPEAMKNMVAKLPIKPQETKATGCEIERMRIGIQ